MQLAIYDGWKEYAKLFERKAKENPNGNEADQDNGSDSESDKENRINILDKVRRIVTKLRTSNATILLREFSSLQPILENDTRFQIDYIAMYLKHIFFCIQCCNFIYALDGVAPTIWLNDFWL